MAYARKYLIEFLDVQNDIFHVYISEKDYIGSVIPLRGATDKAFSTSQKSGDDNIFTAIRAKECEINFVAEGGIRLINFYSEDDEQFRIDFYVHSIDGTVVDKLLSSFFIVQDSCEEDFAAEPFDVALQGTDGLALLKDIPFTTVGMPYDPLNGSEYLGDISLFDFIKIALIQTGLGDLPLRIYSNVFENSTSDRSTDITAEMFEEIFLFTGAYLNDDGSWKDLYTILEDILTTFNCMLCQENGAWNIIRLQEASLFANNAIPGVEHNLTTGTKTAITLDTNIPIIIGTNNIFDQADARDRIQRPYKYVKETFNYRQPESLIYYSNLQIAEGAVPFQSSTVGTERFDDYLLATYFPLWKQTHSDVSYLEIVTDTTTETEIERYILDFGTGTFSGSPSELRGVQFNPIPVTQNDKFNFDVSFRLKTKEPSVIAYFVRIVLITPNDEYYFLQGDPSTGGSANARWTGPFAIASWDDVTVNGGQFGLYIELDGTTPTLDDTSQWAQFELTNQTKDNLPLLIPEDGIMLIEIRGTHGFGQAGSNQWTYLFKDINLSFTQYINKSTQIIGQYHLNTQTAIPKNVYDEEIVIDDSPRITIAGTLLTDALTLFGANIGNVHFTRTKLWHRTTIPEALRLGEIIVFERMHQAFKARMVIEGTLYGLRNQLTEWNFVSLLCILTVDSLPARNFIFGVLEVNWMNASYKAVLNELYQTDSNGELFNYDYLFQYIYKTS